MVFRRLVCFKPFSSSSSTTKSTTGKEKKPDIFDRLPDDVVINILSRLPADCVVRCRRVCKRWSALTLSSGFSKVHVEKAVPGVLIKIHKPLFSKKKKKCSDLFLFRRKSVVVNKERKDHVGVMEGVCYDFLEKHWKENTLLIRSCNGLIAVRSIVRDVDFMVFNPVTREHFILPQPPVTSPYQTVSSSSFFYHPSAKEYRLLISYQHYSGSGNHTKMLIFGFTGGDGGGGMWRELGVVPYRPNGNYRLSTVHNNSLHWMAYSVPINDSDENEIPHCRSSIITFNMTSEEFDCMPHPGSECPSLKRHSHMVLIEMEGKLAICCPSLVQIEVWALEDYENRLWSNTYTVDLRPTLARHPAVSLREARALCFADGELYFFGSRMELLGYHFKKNALEKIYISKMGPPEWKVPVISRVFPYTPSFVSLRELVPTGV